MDPQRSQASQSRALSTPEASHCSGLMALSKCPPNVFPGSPLTSLPSSSKPTISPFRSAPTTSSCKPASRPSNPYPLFLSTFSSACKPSPPSTHSYTAVSFLTLPKASFMSSSALLSFRFPKPPHPSLCPSPTISPPSTLHSNKICFSSFPSLHPLPFYTPPPYN